MAEKTVATELAIFDLRFRAF